MKFQSVQGLRFEPEDELLIRTLRFYGNTELLTKILLSQSTYSSVAAMHLAEIYENKAYSSSHDPIISLNKLISELTDKPLELGYLKRTLISIANSKIRKLETDVTFNPQTCVFYLDYPIEDVAAKAKELLPISVESYVQKPYQVLDNRYEIVTNSTLPQEIRAYYIKELLSAFDLTKLLVRQNLVSINDTERNFKFVHYDRSVTATKFIFEYSTLGIANTIISDESLWKIKRAYLLYKLKKEANSFNQLDESNEIRNKLPSSFEIFKGSFFGFEKIQSKLDFNSTEKKYIELTKNYSEFVKQFRFDKKKKGTQLLYG